MRKFFRCGMTAIMLLLPHFAPAYADAVLDDWRIDVARARGLAENDIAFARKEAIRLQSAIPATARSEDHAKILNLLARIDVYLGDTTSAEQYAKEAFDLAKRSGDRAGQAEADLNIALNTVNQSRFDEMSEAVKHSMTVLEGVNRPELQAEAMLRTSMMFRRFGRLDDSVEMAMRALDIAKRGSNPLVQAYAYQGMAVAYDQSEHKSEARDYYAKMRSAAQEAHSRLLEGDALLGLGSALSEIGDLKNGERLIREGIALYRRTGGPFYLAHGLNSLAVNLQKQGRLAEAQTLTGETIKIYEDKANKVGLWWALTLNNSLHQQQGKFAEAKNDTSKMYRLAQDMGHPYYMSESARMLAGSVAATGDFKRAYKLSSEANELAAKNARETVSVRMLDLSKRFEDENRQRQIDELTRDREQQALRQRWLWTVLAATLLVLGVFAFSFVHVRRNNTKLQTANAELALSQSKLQGTLDAIPDLMFGVDLDGRYYEVHAPHTDLLAAPVEHLLGKTIPDVMPAEAAEVCMSALREANEKGVSFGKQMELPLPQGRFWFELSVARKTQPGSGAPRFVAISRDITPRKLAEETLAEREREFRTLAENIPDHLVRYDLDCRTTYMNATHAVFMGNEAARLLGKTPREAYPDGRYDEYQARMAEVIATGHPAEIEIELQNDGNETNYHQIRFVAERDEKGEIAGVLAIGRDITESKRLQDEIRTREQYQRALLDNFPFMVWLKDTESRLLAINRPYLNAAGLPSDAAYFGKTDLDLFPPELAGQFRADDREVMRSGQQKTVEELVGVPGNIRWHETWKSPVWDKDGKLLGTVGFARDITQTKEAKRLLHEQEQAIRAVVDNSPDNIIRYDTECRRTYLNPAMAKVFGKNASQVIGTSPNESSPLPREYLAAIKAVLANGREERLEIPYPDGDGGLSWVDLRIAPEFGPDGKVVSVLAIGRDITERKRVERDLTLLNSAVNASSESAFLMNEQGRFIYVNDAACRSLGYDRAALLTMTPLDIDPALTPEKFNGMLNSLFFSGPSLAPIETVHRTKDGRVFPIEIAASRLQLDGKNYGLTMVRDISERKAAERELEKYRAHLEELVEERTIALRKSEARYRYNSNLLQSILESPSNSVSIYALDHEYRFLAFNSRFKGAAKRLWGAEIELGMSMLDAIHTDEHREFSKRGFDHILCGNSGFLESKEERIEDGKPVTEYTDNYGSPIYNDAGEVIGLTVFVLNVTERKRMEEALALHEREFRSLAENVPDNIARWDTEGRYLYINPTHERTLGVRASDVIGKKIPDSHDAVIAAIAQVVATGQGASAVRQSALVNGSIEVHDVTLVPEFDESGKIVSVLGIGRDMTGIYRMQETIAAREQEFRSLAESSPDNIVRFDKEGRYCYLNPRLIKQMGVADVKTLIGHLPCEVWPDGRFAAIDKAALKAIESGSMQMVEIALPGPDGEMAFGHISVVPERDAAGEIIGTLAFGRDITERKRMEAALQESEARYRQQYALLQGVLESATDVTLFALDREYRYLAFNAAHRRDAKFLWGTEPKLGQNWLDGLHTANTEEYREFCRRGFDRVLSGESFSIESNEKVLLDDGRVLDQYFDNFGSPIRNEAGEVIGLTVFSVNITQRKATERKLKETLELTEGVINAIPDILFEVDKNGLYLNVWTRYPELLAAQRERLLGKTVNEVLPPDFAAAAMRAISEADEKGESLIDDVSLDLPQGKRWFSHSLSKKSGSTPDEATFLVLSRDITERKEAEEEVRKLNAELELRVQERTAELAAREREFRTLAESIPDNIVRYDRDARKTYLNTATAKLMGIKAEDILQQTPEETPERVRAMDVSQFAERLRRVLTTGEPQEFEATLRHAEFGTQIHNVRFVPERDDSGEIVGALMVGHDITALKVYERELEEREQRYHEIFDNAVESMFLLEVTEDGRFRNLDVNPALCKAVGIPREAMIGKYVDETVAEETGRRVVEKYRHCAVSGKTIEEASELELPVGKRHFYSTITPIYSGGRVHRLIGISRDVTELKRVESELQESREQLRGLMAQREEAREEERKYIAREVHDELGQILTGLKLNVSLLDHQLTKQRAEIRDRVKETMSLTDRSLEVARNVASALRPAALDMGIVSALEWLAARFGRNTGVDCSVIVEDMEINLPERSAVALFRIVQESLTNVARHAQAKKVKISIVRAQDDYVLKVSDNGKGFDLGKKKMDSFGLVGIRERALLLGGEVSINSRPGKGTEVVVRIPEQNLSEEA